MYMFASRKLWIAGFVSRPRPRQIASATIPSAAELVDEAEGSSPWTTEGPTRNTPGTFADSSSAVSRGAPARQPFATSDSPARVGATRSERGNGGDAPFKAGAQHGRLKRAPPARSLGACRGARARRDGFAATIPVAGGSAAFHSAMTLKPPSAARSTRSTRRGARSFGRGREPSGGYRAAARRCRAPARWTGLGLDVPRGSRGEHRALLARLGQINAASTPLSYPGMITSPPEARAPGGGQRANAARVVDAATRSAPGRRGVRLLRRVGTRPPPTRRTARAASVGLRSIDVSSAHMHVENAVDALDTTTSVRELTSSFASLPLAPR